MSSVYALYAEQLYSNRQRYTGLISREIHTHIFAAPFVAPIVIILRINLNIPFTPYRRGYWKMDVHLMAGQAMLGKCGEQLRAWNERRNSYTDITHWCHTCQLTDFGSLKEKKKQRGYKDSEKLLFRLYLWSAATPKLRIPIWSALLQQTPLKLMKVIRI